MIKKEHAREVEKIGEDSCGLFHFAQLSAGATVEQQVAALNRDRKWLCDHNNEICGRIDDLIKLIRGY